MIAARAHDFPRDSCGDEQMNTMARTSTAMASRSRASISTSSDCELHGEIIRNPSESRSSRRDLSWPPPDCDLHCEIRCNVYVEDRDAGTILIHVAVLLLAPSPSLL
ncbi:hypothetical protein TIFTF001_008044 [Ficus carica]|uniref:Uncharacterized protein n=1 Tax=Ficus carica TaxID=3494 RepID=A0AA88AED7_FICCA|nr:hypothetical protein TIFTF001_008044 [Ficus carica]